MNHCEIEELRTQNSWFTGRTTEEEDRVIIRDYVNVLEVKERVIPSDYYPLTGKYEVFNYTNTHMIGVSEEDRHILSIFDKVHYQLGEAYKNSDNLTKALREAGYNAQTYTGWLFENNHVIHHAWTVLWVHERPSVLDLSDMMMVVGKLILPDAKMSDTELRRKFATVAADLMKRPNHERCAPVGIPSLPYYYVGSPSTGAEGVALFNKVAHKYPNHPCMARYNRFNGKNPTHELVRKKMR